MKTMQQKMTDKIKCQNFWREVCRTQRVNICGMRPYWFMIPLALIVHIIDIIKQKKDDKLQWSEARAKQFWDTYLIQLGRVSKDGLSIDYRCRWYGVTSHKYCYKWRDRAFAYKFCDRLDDYLYDKYEIEGMEKEQDPDYGFVTFTQV